MLLKEYIKNAYILLFNKICFLKVKIMGEERYIKKVYKKLMKEELNLKNPVTFSEKLQWLKFNKKNDEYTKLVDKLGVREFIKEKIGEKYLVEILGVYESADSINIEDLPEKFILKTTHDSGGVVICEDKNKFNLKLAKFKLRMHMKRNFYYCYLEYPYKNVKPQIICEKFLNDGVNKDLIDYKVYCFNGKAKFIQVHFNRSISHKIQYYDLNWRIMDLKDEKIEINKGIEKPGKLGEMIRLSEKLSENIPFCRVDFYSIKDELTFGEITFFPNAGFKKFIPEEYNKALGDWIRLE